MKKYFALALLIISGIGLVLPESNAANIRLRAREHFDWMRIKFPSGGGSHNYTGLSNTFNLWIEEPFEYSIGLAFGPLLGSARATSSFPNGTNKKIRLWNIGVEGKYFPWSEKKCRTFLRAALTTNILDTRGPEGKLKGWGYYLGVGYEISLSDKIALAPELGFRHVLLERSGQILAFTPSLGLHFYTNPDFLKI